MTTFKLLEEDPDGDGDETVEPKPWRIDAERLREMSEHVSEVRVALHQANDDAGGTG